MDSDNDIFYKFVVIVIVKFIKYIIILSCEMKKKMCEIYFKMEIILF